MNKRTQEKAMVNEAKSSTALKPGQWETKSLGHFFQKFLNDWSLDFSAMLAYNLLIALLPMTVAVIAILGLIFRNNSDNEKGIKDKKFDSLSNNSTTGNGIDEVNIHENFKQKINHLSVFLQVFSLAFKELSKNAGVFLFLGIILAIFGSSRLFIAIDKCMTIIYRLPERPFLHQNLVGIGMVFVFILLIPIMLTASSLPSILLSFITNVNGRIGAFIAGILCSLLVAFILFETIYWIIPNKTMSFKLTWRGALIAACALELFLILFPLYIRKFMGNYTGKINHINSFFLDKHFFCIYKGNIGFAVILLLFLYYFAVILILGAQINAYFFEHYQPLIDGLGTYISQMLEEHGGSDPRRPLCENNSEIP